MNDPRRLGINSDGTYNHIEHERVMGYTQNVTLAELLAIEDDDIIQRHDALLSVNYGNSILGADEYRAEYNRRATVRLAEASEEYTRTVNRLLILLAVLALVPLALDVWDRFHWGDHLGGLWAAFYAAIGGS